MNVTLTDGQRAKLRSSFKQRHGVTIQLTKEQLLETRGKDTINLNENQRKDISKSRTAGKGCRLNLSYNQLKENYKGGFLPLVFGGLAALGSLIGAGSSVANSIIDYKDRKKKLEETVRHNKAMEGIQKGGRLRGKTPVKSKKQNSVKKKIRSIK